MWHWWFVLCIMQGLHEYAIEIATANDLMYRKNLFHLIISGCWFGTSVILHNIWDNPSHRLIFLKMVIAPPTRYKSVKVVSDRNPLYTWLLHSSFMLWSPNWEDSPCISPGTFFLVGFILAIQLPQIWLVQLQSKTSKTIYSTLGLVQSPLYSSVNKHNHGKLPICRWFI